LYKNFCNAYAYYIALFIGYPSPNKQNVFKKAQDEWKFVRIEVEKPHYNVIAQKSTLEKQKCAKDCLKRMQQLKQHATAQARSQAKKCQALKDRGEVIKYDTPGNHHIFLDEMPKHIDEHYCLHIVKSAKQFAHTFVSHSVIILQNNIAKVPLGIPAIGRMFKTLQIARELVEIPDHDFSKGSIQKLIPSVYLTIDMEDSNNLLCN
ncbi:2044_t:CDS:2, partial [Gigaspora margarita]